jgi:hypothetical protein
VRALNIVKRPAVLIALSLMLTASFAAITLAAQTGPAPEDGGTQAAAGTDAPADGTAAGAEASADTASAAGADEAGEPSAEPAQPASGGYRKAAENDRLALYVNPATLGIRVANKETGYVWHGALDEKDEKLNQTWQAFFESGLTVEVMDAKRKVSMFPVSAGAAAVTVDNAQDGFSADVRYEKLGIRLQLQVRLTEDGVEVRVPEASIEETSKENRLQSLYLYPFFGATKGVQADEGYMLIPDGSGALIHLNEPTLASQPYIARVYGSDLGMTASTPTEENWTYPPETIYLPVYGIAHRPGADAFVSLITGGAPYAEVRAYPSGVTTAYNWTAVRWIFRESYFQPLDKKGNGMTLNQAQRNAFEASMHIMLLSGERADYSGMAVRVREELVRRGELPPLREDGEAPPPVRLEVLAAENKSRLLGRSVIPMTTLQELDGMLEDLRGRQFERMMVVVRGYSKGGFAGSSPKHLPFERKVGAADDWRSLLAKYDALRIPIYFYTDYATVDDDADGYGKADIAKTISEQFIPLYWRTWLLQPASTMRLFREELPAFGEHGIDRLAIGTIGNNLFSSYAREVSTRAQSIETYRSLLAEESVESFAVYQPNLYLWAYTDAALDVPMNASGFLLESEEVPFLQQVLSGHLDDYAPASNFEADPQQALLKRIDYGSYPSFQVTGQDPVLLADTGSGWLYTSQYEVWKERIAEEARIVGEALRPVARATFDRREEVEPGVYRNRYSNGVVIYVNYTGEDALVDGNRVPARGFLVKEGSGA